MSNTPDSAGRDLSIQEEEMNTPESVLQRLRSERAKGGPLQMLGRRVSWVILAGAIVVVVLALAFLLRPGESTDAGKVADPAPAAATATPAVVPVAGAPTAPAEQPTPLPVAQKERIHTVVAGDTLGLLAEKYYGDFNKFNVIYEANRDILSDPDSLQLGQELKIPD
jgi:hypothetical protein